MDRPTDVLSFPVERLPGEPEDGYLGHIVLSAERSQTHAPPSDVTF